MSSPYLPLRNMGLLLFQERIILTFNFDKDLSPDMPTAGRYVKTVYQFKHPRFPFYPING